MIEKIPSHFLETAKSVHKKVKFIILLDLNTLEFLFLNEGKTFNSSDR